MEAIDIWIGIGVVLSSIIGGLVTWWYKKRKLKEEKETLDAQELLAKEQLKGLQKKE